MGELSEFRDKVGSLPCPFCFSNGGRTVKTRIIVAGKFDPVHQGHVDAIRKASELGDYLIIITHADDIVAMVSKKGFCAVPFWARSALLMGLIYLYKEGHGDVVLSVDENGESTETLRLIRKRYPKDRLIFAKGGDRKPDSMPIKEIKVCQELDIEIRYGVGDLLNSSSEIMEKILN